MIDLVIASIAATQCGTFSRHQALDAGANDSLIRRRLRSGAWVTFRPGVYGLPGHRDTWDKRLWIVYLAAGQYAAVAYDSAAAQYGTPGFPRDGLHLTIPHPHHQRVTGATVQATRVGWDTLRFPWEELVGDAEDAAATLLDTYELRRDLLRRAG